MAGLAFTGATTATPPTDLFWIKDNSLTDTDALPSHDVIAAEIINELETALEQFSKIAARLAAPSGSAN